MLTTRDVAPWFSRLPAGTSFEEHVRVAMSGLGLPILDWGTTRSPKDRKLKLWLISTQKAIAALDKATISRLKARAGVLGYWGLEIKSSIDEIPLQ